MRETSGQISSKRWLPTSTASSPPEIFLSLVTETAAKLPSLQSFKATRTQRKVLVLSLVTSMCEMRMRSTPCSTTLSLTAMLLTQTFSDLRSRSKTLRVQQYWCVQAWQLHGMLWSSWRNGSEFSRTTLTHFPCPLIGCVSSVQGSLHGGRITLSQVWTFPPHHDDTRPPHSSHFLT